MTEFKPAPIGPQLKEIASIPGRVISRLGDAAHTVVVGRPPTSVFIGERRGLRKLRSYIRDTIDYAAKTGVLTDEGEVIAKQEAKRALFRSGSNILGLIVMDGLTLSGQADAALFTYVLDMLLRHHYEIDFHRDVGNKTAGVRLTSGKVGMAIAGANFSRDAIGGIISGALNQIPIIGGPLNSVLSCISLPLVPGTSMLLAYHIDAVRQGFSDAHAVLNGLSAAQAKGRGELRAVNENKAVTINAMETFGVTEEPLGIDINMLSTATPLDPNKFK